MVEVLVTITHLAQDQVKLAESALAAIANDPMRYQVKAVRDMKSEAGEVGARLQISREPPTKLAQAAVWNSLESVMRERGVVWKTDRRRTDALENEAAITQDQIHIQVISHQVLTSIAANCDKTQAGKTFADWDAAQYEVQELRKDQRILCIQIWEVPTQKFEEGLCRPDGKAAWSHCGQEGSKVVRVHHGQP